uniref:Uncharacterized protein n=1 Tax=Pipistrellus kuhlii TaxID=59472 RepID=A0A7J7TB09_PIPKU|nr:hypothetical protein mPipKuh1_009670 [Pipistrellus kuhlii]
MGLAPLQELRAGPSSVPGGIQDQFCASASRGQRSRSHVRLVSVFDFQPDELLLMLSLTCQPPSSSHCVGSPCSIAIPRHPILERLRRLSANAPGGSAGTCGWWGEHCRVILVYYTVLISDDLNLNLFKKYYIKCCF